MDRRNLMQNILQSLRHRIYSYSLMRDPEESPDTAIPPGRLVTAYRHPTIEGQYLALGLEALKPD